MSDVRIADVEVGRPVEGVFAVAKKQRRHDRNGDTYLVVELTDETGVIEGRIWRNADWFDREIREGDRVRAVGRGTSFRNQTQLDIRRLDRVGDDDERTADRSFVPQSRRSLDDLTGELDFLIDELQQTELASVVLSVWRGADRDLLTRSPATAGDHHAHVGGLVEHTVNVAAMVLAAADRHPSVDRELLLAAALLHDIGRARELRVAAAISADREQSLVGHVLLTHELLLAALRSCGLTTDASWWPQLVHAVSTHHGPLERCRTREAQILASCNQLDSRLAYERD